MKQSCPKDLDEAITATLEMESYAMRKVRQSGTAVTQVPEEIDGGGGNTLEQIPVASVRLTSQLISLMESLVGPMEEIKRQLVKDSSPDPVESVSSETKTTNYLIIIVVVRDSMCEDVQLLRDSKGQACEGDTSVTNAHTNSSITESCSGLLYVESCWWSFN